MNITDRTNLHPVSLLSTWTQANKRNLRLSEWKMKSGFFRAEYREGSDSYSGEGRNKKLAKMFAAKAALRGLAGIDVDTLIVQPSNVYILMPPPPPQAPFAQPIPATA